MVTVYVCWVIAAAVLIVAAAWIGNSVRKTALGIFIDSRGRFSLSQLQITLWTVLIFSLLVGVFVARLTDPASRSSALDITIPSQLLIVMGISAASTATATAIKAGKDLRNVSILEPKPPKFSQVFLVEEGNPGDPEVVDVSKFQNFWLTLIIIVAYIFTAIAYISANGNPPSGLTSLPGFSDSMLVLLGISHAGYLAGKLPDRSALRN